MILISRYTTLRFLLVQSVFPLSCCFFEFQITIFSQIYFILVDKSTCLMVIIVNEEKGLASGVVEDFIFMPVCFDLD